MQLGRGSIKEQKQHSVVSTKVAAIGGARSNSRDEDHLSKISSLDESGLKSLRSQALSKRSKNSNKRDNSKNLSRSRHIVSGSSQLVAPSDDGESNLSNARANFFDKQNKEQLTKRQFFEDNQQDSFLQPASAHANAK